MNKCNCVTMHACPYCDEAIHDDGCPQKVVHACSTSAEPLSITKESQHDANVIEIFKAMCSTGVPQSFLIETMWENSKRYAKDLNSSK